MQEHPTFVFIHTPTLCMCVRVCVGWSACCVACCTNCCSLLRVCLLVACFVVACVGWAAATQPTITVAQLPFEVLLLSPWRLCVAIQRLFSRPKSAGPAPPPYLERCTVQCAVAWPLCTTAGGVGYLMVCGLCLVLFLCLHVCVQQPGPQTHIRSRGVSGLRYLC